MIFRTYYIINTVGYSNQKGKKGSFDPSSQGMGSKTVTLKLSNPESEVQSKAKLKKLKIRRGRQWNNAGREAKSPKQQQQHVREDTLTYLQAVNLQSISQHSKESIHLRERERE